MGKKGCLLIHGFGGSIKEVEPLVQPLEEQGYIVHKTALKGHTRIRQDLKNVTYQDWIDSAENDLQTMLVLCESVFIIGFSMGGLIAINLGIRYKINGVVTINTPIYYWNIKRIIFNIAGGIINRDLRNIKRYVRSSAALPVNALLNFRQLLKYTKRQLGKLKCPIFTLQAIHDDTVRRKSADYIYCHVSSQVKQLEFYDSREHLILWSEQANSVIDDIDKFLKDNSITPQM